MRSAHTVAQVREAEERLFAVLPEGALMQRAAAGLATAIADFLGTVYGARILLLVGPGDNGGDALFAGALLARRGASVEAVLVTGSAHTQAEVALRRAGGRLVETPRSPDVVIDGILGIGGRPGLPARAVELLADLRGVPVVAVDLPSGLAADSGRIDDDHVTADLTVTFGTLKPAHLVQPAAAACGVVEVVDLGLDLPAADLRTFGEDDVRRLLPRPTAADHKYTRGVVGLDTGSADYPGAAVLGVAGALTGWCGMVRYAGGAPEAVTAAHPEVVAGAGRVQAWVVGSGGGDEARAAYQRARHDEVPVVVDADALAHVEPGSGQVLTPHAGELAAILGVERAEVEADQLAFVRRAARTYDCVVLLKGAHSLIADPDGKAWANTTGTPWLGTAGAGDVLAGLIGALLATGLPEAQAAAVGAWLHGRAAQQLGGPLSAGELPAQITRLGQWFGHDHA